MDKHFKLYMYGSVYDFHPIHLHSHQHTHTLFNNFQNFLLYPFDAYSDTCVLVATTTTTTKILSYFSLCQSRYAHLQTPFGFSVVFFSLFWLSSFSFSISTRSHKNFFFVLAFPLSVFLLLTLLSLHQYIVYYFFSNSIFYSTI